MNPHYLAWALRRYERDILSSCAKNGTTVQSIETARLRGFPLPLPPLPEQHRIVAAIEEQFSRLDAGVVSLQRAKRNIARMRAAVLTAAVEGRVDDRRFGDRADSSEYGEHSVRSVTLARWQQTTLGNIVDGLRYGTSTRCAYGANGEPVLRIPNVRGRTVDLTDLKRAIDHAANLGTTKVRTGDLLFIRTNGSPDLIGRVSVVPQSADGYAFASYLIRGRPRPDVSASFYALVLDSPVYRALLRQRAATSAGQYNISASSLASIPVPLPSLAEQQAIVGEVERQFSILDAMDATVDAGLSRAASLRQSILSEAFAGRLVPQDPGGEPVSALRERMEGAEVAV